MRGLVLSILSACIIGAVLAETDCQTMCKGPCNTAKSTCDASGANSATCDLGYNKCAGSCDKICKCVDDCDTQCQPALDSCLANNEGDAAATTDCNNQRTDCFSTCVSECDLTK